MTDLLQQFLRRFTSEVLYNVPFWFVLIFQKWHEWLMAAEFPIMSTACTVLERGMSAQL